MSYHSARHDQASSPADSYPLNSWEQAQRGRSGYQVASGTSYIPDFRDRSASPISMEDRAAGTYQAYRPAQQGRPQLAGQSTLHPLPVVPLHAGPPHSSALQSTGASPYGVEQDSSHHSFSPPSPYSPSNEHLQPQYPYDGPRASLPQNPSFSSQTGLASAAALPPYQHSADAVSRSSLDDFSSSRQQTNQGYGVYPARPTDSPVPFGTIDPNTIDDDEDIWGAPRSKKNKRSTVVASVAAIGASKGARDSSGSYNPVGMNPNGTDNEKNQWLIDEARKRKRRKWLVIGIIGVIVVAAIVGGAIGAVITTRASNALEHPSVDDGPALTKDSAEIQALMQNPALHKVFPGMDYTPLNTQYPGCLTNPPSQNNVTRDIAVLSQLTPEIRLYGTDCNQTEMVLHAIDVLDLSADMKIWLGVWQDANETTNARQLQQMYDVFDQSKQLDSISGVVIGNEVLFSESLEEAQLIDIISGVRSNLTGRGLKIPVATSDLGSNWTPTLAAAVDVVMANVHPFFGGVAAPAAAAWTWDFWQTQDVALTAGTDKKHTISEVGWPSSGGNDCGSLDTKCPDATSGSVAGIDEMNTFMGDWVCQSLANQTSYFWFEAFDEPWKIQYNTPGQEWEDKWGLMDVNRKVKKGVTIPDCGGQTAGPTTWPAPMAS